MTDHFFPAHTRLGKAERKSRKNLAPLPRKPAQTDDDVSIVKHHSSNTGKSEQQVRRKYAEPEAFALTTYTEAEIAQREKARAAYEAEHAPAMDRPPFALTGSDRPADVAVAHGQKDLK